jgi:hypothetical protein
MKKVWDGMVKGFREKAIRENRHVYRPHTTGTRESMLSVASMMLIWLGNDTGASMFAYFLLLYFLAGRGVEVALVPFAESMLSVASMMLIWLGNDTGASMFAYFLLLYFLAGRGVEVALVPFADAKMEHPSEFPEFEEKIPNVRLWRTKTFLRHTLYAPQGINTRRLVFCHGLLHGYDSDTERISLSAIPAERQHIIP